MKTQTKIQKNQYIETLKRSFSKFCYSLVKSKQIDYTKLMQQRDLIVTLILNEYIRGKISREYCDMSIHYVNKCYLITMKKLNVITYERYFNSK